MGVFLASFMFEALVWQDAWKKMASFTFLSFYKLIKGIKTWIKEPNKQGIQFL